MTRICVIFFFFNDTATTEIYTLSLHDALPIYPKAFVDASLREIIVVVATQQAFDTHGMAQREDRRVEIHRHTALFGIEDRKSTRLNSSHANISYAVFCLKKKKK